MVADAVELSWGYTVGEANRDVPGPQPKSYNLKPGFK